MSNIYGYGINGYPSYPSGSGGTAVNAGEGLQSISNADGSITLSASDPYITFYYDSNIPNSRALLSGQNVTIVTGATGITINAQVSGSGATSSGTYITGVTEASLPNSYVATQGNGITLTLAGGAATFGVASTITGATLLTYATGNTIFPNSKIIKAGNNISLTVDATSISINDTFSPTSSGTVTSVGLAAPNFFTVSGSPITGSGTLSFALNSAPQSTLLIAPSSGAGVPYFRGLTYADLPIAAGTNVTLTSNASNGLTIGFIDTDNFVSSVSVGNIGTIITTSVANASSTPAITFTIAPEASASFWRGPFSGISGTPFFGPIVGTDINSIFVPSSNITFTPSGTSINVALVGVGSSNTNGTVTSVALGMPNIFTVTGSPITSSGTLNVSLANQTSGSGVFAAPYTGSSAAPAFRGLVGQDISSIFTTGSNVVITPSGTSINVSLTGVGSSNTNGTVTSVGLSAPSFLAVSGSPVTTSGTLGLALVSQPCSTLLIAPTAGGLPTFRNLLAADLPITAGSNISLAVNATGGLAISSVASGGGGGTVTSVGVSVPSILSVSGSPVTNSGTIAISLANQPSGAGAFMAPVNGSPAIPSFRPIQGQDISPIFLQGNNVTITTSGSSITIAAAGSSNTNGTVTSVGLSTPNIFTVSGSPVINAGTLAFTLNSAPQNTFLAAPSAANGVPYFRGIVGPDLPLTAGPNITLTLNSTGGISISSIASGSGGGSVTSVALGNLSPLFTASVANPTTSASATFTAVSQASGAGFYGAPISGAAAAPSFRIIQGQDISSIFTTGSNVVITTPGSSINIALTGVGSSNTNGTVTSVVLSTPSFLTVSSSPITTSGPLSQVSPFSPSTHILPIAQLDRATPF